MSTMLDPMFVKQFERENRYKFTYQELETARENEGEVAIWLENRVRYVRIPTLRFPEDLTEQEFFPEGYNQ